MTTPIADDAAYIAKRLKEIRESECRPTLAELISASGARLDEIAAWWHVHRQTGESDYTLRQRIEIVIKAEA